MQNFTKKNLLNLFLLLILSAQLYAQENPIKFLDIKIRNDKMYVAGQFENLINLEMKETLISGMSSSLHFNLKLINANSETISEIGETIYLRYNVWDKVYSLRISDIGKFFENFNQFEKFLNDSMVFIVENIEKLPSNQKIYVVLSFSPESISDSQKNKLNFWLKSKGEMKESKPAYESESTFSINLSNLISIFLNKKSDSQLYVFESTPFTIQSLKNNENIAQ